MEFRKATDGLAGCFSLDEIAAAMQMSGNTIRRARMDPSSPNARSAPPGWQKTLARLARIRARDLLRLADQLDRDAT
jgi:hypothetical protein